MFVRIAGSIMFRAFWVLVAIAASTSAYAGSFKDSFPQGSASIWAGRYAGLHLGGAWGQAKGRADGVAGSETLDLDGALGGAHLGYNWQNQSFVYGVEFDVTFSDLEGSKGYALDNVFDLAGATGSLSNHLNHLISVRGRLGFAQGDFLFYATGGVAFTDYRLKGSLTDGVTTFAGSVSDDTFGYVLGGGVDWKFSRNWSIRAEVLHYEFQDIRFSSPELGVVRVDADTTVIRTGFSIHLN